MSFQQISIDNLWSGTSFQPPWKRFPGQVPPGGMINIDPDVISGARDRNGTDLIKRLNFTGGQHWERLRDMIIGIRPEGIQVVDEDGNRLVVNDLTGGSFAYLGVNSPAPEDDYDTITVGDTVIICNKLVTTAMTTSDDYTTKGTVPDFTYLIKDTTDTPQDPNPVAVSNPQAGDIWLVDLAINRSPSGYYRFNGGSQTNPLAWERIPPPNSPNAVWDDSTMPHALVYNETINQWTFGALTWSSRLSGSDNTNPAPAFNGHTIDCMAFYQGRIVCFGNGQIVSTHGGDGDKYSFFINDVNNQISDDPFNIYNDLEGIFGNPMRAGVIGRDMVVACERGQARLTAGPDPVNDNNVRLFPLTSYPSRPAKIESNGQILVITDYNNYVHAYGWMNVNVGAQYLATLNMHDPKVLQPTQVGDKVVRRVYVTKDRIIIATDGDAAIFKYFMQDGQMQQAAWHKWTFVNSTHRLIYADLSGANIRLITKDEDETHYLLEYYPEIEPYAVGWDYLPALDYREQSQYKVYDAANDRTAFDHSTLDGSADYWLVKNTCGHNQYYPCIAFQGRRVWFKGDHRDCLGSTTNYIGIGYTASLTASELWAGPFDANVMLKKIDIAYSLNSTNFELVLKRKGATSNVLKKRINGKFILGAKKLNTSMNQYGVFSTWAAGDARYHDIVLQKSNPGRITWNSITYQVDSYLPGGN